MKYADLTPVFNVRGERRPHTFLVLVNGEFLQLIFV